MWQAYCRVPQKFPGTSEPKKRRNLQSATKSENPTGGVEGDCF